MYHWGEEQGVCRSPCDFLLASSPGLLWQAPGGVPIPVNTIQSPNIDVMFGQRRRRWTYITSTLGDCRVYWAVGFNVYQFHKPVPYSYILF